MRKFIANHRILVVVLMTALSVLLLSGIALALASLTVHHTANIVAPPSAPLLKLYSDAGCQNEIISIAWGDVTQGTASTQIVYLKNIGTAMATVTVGGASVDGGKVVLTSNYPAGGTLAVGISQAITFTFTVDPGATVGSVLFDNVISY